MLCCILIALLAPLGVSLASWRSQSRKADCCRPAFPWLTVVLLTLGGGVLCTLLVLATFAGRRAGLGAWPICTVFGLRAAATN